MTPEDKQKRITVLNALKAGDFKEGKALMKLVKNRRGVKGAKGTVPYSRWTWLHFIHLHQELQPIPLEVTQYLIDQKVDVNAVDSYRMTVLHYAARNQDLATVKLLLQAGADPNLVNFDKLKAFDYMVENLEAVALFLDYGVDINHPLQQVKDLIRLEVLSLCLQNDIYKGEELIRKQKLYELLRPHFNGQPTRFPLLEL